MVNAAIKSIIKPLYSGFGAISCSSFAIGETALFSVGGVAKYLEGQIILATTIPLLLGGAYVCGIDYIGGPGREKDEKPGRKQENRIVEKALTPSP